MRAPVPARDRGGMATKPLRSTPANRAARSARRPVARFVALPDGRRLHALTWKGRGTALVLLHGVLDSASGWNDLCRATSRPCIAIDLGGFGESDLPAQPSFAAYADDVIVALDDLGCEDYVLVGHSLGGAVATLIAEHRPGQVRALVLLAPAGFGRVPLAEMISLPGVRIVARRVLPLTLTSRAAVAATYRTVISNGRDASDEVLERILDKRGALVPGAVEATKAVVRGGLSAHALHRRRVAYDGDVTVVWGDHDRVVPAAHAAGVARALPQAQFHTWSGMGHHPQVERPAELAELIENACRRAETARALSAAA